MQRIGGVLRDEVLSVSEEVVQRFLRLPENKKPERKGGYLTIMNKFPYQMYFVNEIGECLLSIDGFKYSQEKVNRLYENNSALGHISAWQSRDRGSYKYGGAITAPINSKGRALGSTLIGGFSGIDEHSEEAILLVIWMIFRWLTLEDAEEIVAISENKFLEPLLKASNDLFDRPSR